MKQLSLPDDLYNSLEELAAKKGQTVEESLAAMIMQDEWESYAEAALQEYETWKTTHTPEYLTEEEFFAELAGAPQHEHTNADV